MVIHECHKNATTEDVPDVYYKFTAALYGLFGFLQAIAIQVILTHCCIYKQKRKKVKSDNEGKWKQMETNWKFLPWLVFLVLILLSLAICAVGLEYDFNLKHCFNDRGVYIAISGYHTLLLLTTVIIDVVLLQLMFATLYASYIWATENNERGNRDPGQAEVTILEPEPGRNGDSRSHNTEVKPKPGADRSDNPEQVSAGDHSKKYLELKTEQSVSYSEICCAYCKKGKEVRPFTSTFEAWFVLQWFIYFLGIFIDLTYVVRPWIGSGDAHHSALIYKQHPLEYAYLALFIVYDVFVLIVPFFCGIKMNDYHKIYYSKQVKKKLKKDNFDFLKKDKPEKEKGALEYALITHLKVKKEEEFDFTPSILSMDIPLTNPGYILSIVIAMVTLILGVIVNPVDLSQQKP